MASQAEQDYIKTILELEQAGERAATSVLAGRLDVAPASVTSMLEHLAAKGLIVYTPYHGAQLTATGRALGLETIRHHRLIELYLQQALGFSWDEVHSEADRLEHAISERVEERMAQALGDPAIDPHGDPIPRRDGQVPASSVQALAETPAGSTVTVSRVTAQQPDILRYLASIGIVLGATVHVLEQAPFDGPVTVQVGKERRALSAELARGIYVDSAAA